MADRAALIPKKPWYRPAGLAKRFALCAAVVYTAICVFLYSIQSALTYPIKQTGADLSTEVAVTYAKSLGLEPWNQTSPGASAPQGFVRHDFGQPAPRGTIVVFHGNGGAAFNRLAYVAAFTRRGFRTFLYEYPGYGGRPGQPSEKAIVPDARALVRSLDQAGYGPVYICGESLGAGVAAAVCADPTMPVHGLILITPWDNIANVGLSIYPWIPVRLLMIDKYDSVANLAHFSHPICVTQSENDEVIPAALTENLYAHLPQTRKLILQKGCGHNDWPNAPELPWWDDALNFIAPK